MIYQYSKPDSLNHNNLVLLPLLHINVAKDKIIITDEDTEYIFTKAMLDTFNSGTVLCFYAYESKVKNIPVTKEDGTTEYKGKLIIDVYDSLSVSLSNRNSNLAPIWSRSDNVYAKRLFYLIVPSKEESFDGMDMVFMTPNDVNISINLPVTPIPNPTSFFEEYMPKLQVSDTTVSRDGLVTLTASVYWHNELYDKPIDLFIESDMGYINKTRVTTSNGTASVKFRATDLDVSDIATVKWGYKYFTNAASSKVVVIG